MHEMAAMIVLERSFFFLTLITALGCGLMAGVFFAFSAFIMPALSRLAPSGGIAAMQSINITAVTPVFMLAVFGTAVACIVLALLSLLRWNAPVTAYVLAGSVLYLVGAIAVTIAFNVPRNDALAGVVPASDAGLREWTGYLAVWTAWNHVRAVASLAAMASFVLALARWR